ncbi:hypothetical protein [Bosea sp. ASV33]|uniref:LexA family protein n=1 Tax=Bosea sp. ASV33 TaxID=2795106 RepID=UPI0018ED15E7|nr:hypothetical protein [Bosea sp. ASV33]
MSTGLTKRQRALLDFVNEFAAREGQPPSYEQMAAGVGLRSKSGAFRLMAKLEERGAIRRLPNRARSIEVIDQSSFPRDLEESIAVYCRNIGIPRATFDQRAAECLLRGGVA